MNKPLHIIFALGCLLTPLLSFAEQTEIPAEVKTHMESEIKRIEKKYDRSEAERTQALKNILDMASNLGHASDISEITYLNSMYSSDHKNMYTEYYKVSDKYTYTVLQDNDFVVDIKPDFGTLRNQKYSKPIQEQARQQKALKFIRSYSEIPLDDFKLTVSNKEEYSFYNWEIKSKDSYQRAQVSMLPNGDIYGILFIGMSKKEILSPLTLEDTHPRNPEEPAPAFASNSYPQGEYIYANGGSFYQAFGVSQY
jgi:hypothetical protein